MIVLIRVRSFVFRSSFSLFVLTAIEHLHSGNIEDEDAADF